MNQVLWSKKSDEWKTPAGIYEVLDREFHFDLDPCPLGGDQDGRASLFVEWRDKIVFCNPPYSDIDGFLRRAREAKTAVYLIPVRTDTRYFSELIMPHAKEIRFIRGRLKFGNASTCAPFPSMIVVFEQGHTGPPAVSMFRRS